MSTLVSLRDPRRERLRALTPLVCGPPFGAFEGTSGDGDANVYRACVGDVAGEASKITSFNDGGLTSEGCHNPVLSPDGSKILFELSNPSTGYQEIWVVSSTPGSGATQLLADASNYYMHPWWHPDGDRFLCVHGSGGSFDGSIISTSVSDPGTVATLKSTDGIYSPFRPQFNFDGSRIAYMWDKQIGAGGELRVMDPDGSNDSLLDTIDRYRFQGGQYSWANAANKLAYDNGAGGVNTAYVINDDGTGKTQINANGVAAGANVRVSDRAWPPGDGYVVVSSQCLGLQLTPVRAELDGSNTTALDATHGASGTAHFRQVLVAGGRIWFIESSLLVVSIALAGGDYRVDLTIDGAAMNAFTTGDGWYYN